MKFLRWFFVCVFCMSLGAIVGWTNKPNPKPQILHETITFYNGKELGDCALVDDIPCLGFLGVIVLNKQQRGF